MEEDEHNMPEDLYSQPWFCQMKDTLEKRFQNLLDNVKEDITRECLKMLKFQMQRFMPVNREKKECSTTDEALVSTITPGNVSRKDCIDNKTMKTSSDRLARSDLENSLTDDSWACLRALGLDIYAPFFVEEGWETFEDFLNMDDEDLKRCIPKPGHRRRLELKLRKHRPEVKFADTETDGAKKEDRCISLIIKAYNQDKSDRQLEKIKVSIYLDVDGEADGTCIEDDIEHTDTLFNKTPAKVSRSNINRINEIQLQAQKQVGTKGHKSTKEYRFLEMLPDERKGQDIKNCSVLNSGQVQSVKNEEKEDQVIPGTQKQDQESENVTEAIDCEANSNKVKQKHMTNLGILDAGPMQFDLDTKTKRRDKARCKGIGKVSSESDLTLPEHMQAYQSDCIAKPGGSGRCIGNTQETGQASDTNNSKF